MILAQRAESFAVHMYKRFFVVLLTAHTITSGGGTQPLGTRIQQTLRLIVVEITTGKRLVCGNGLRSQLSPRLVK
jgi:hypothetical protein